MEVFICNVAPRETKKSLGNFLENILKGLEIEDWSFVKLPQKNWAKLFFLNKEDGLKFFGRHGTSLCFKDRILRCNISYSKDKFAIQCLEMDKEDRIKAREIPAKSEEISSTKKSKVFACTSISCGLWDYIGGELIFKPHFTWTESASISFRSSSVLFQMGTSRRMNIFHNCIESVAWGGLAAPAVIFTLREAPRFFCSAYSGLSEGMDEFISAIQNAFASLDIFDPNGPEWNRVSGLVKEHEKIAGGCLVYRFVLEKTNELSARLKSLSLTRGMSSMTRRHINVCQPSESYATEFKQLLQLLLPNATSLPFAIKFQIQKLAQNGYLSPSKVITLLPAVKPIYLRSGKTISVNAIRKLFLQIPYVAPDSDHSYFEIENLVNMLRMNEDMIISGSLYEEEPLESGQTATIHKVIVTPAGIYLYGPERESNNRILRKYPNNHDNFVRVQFSDEDGQPIHFNSEFSNRPIFDRFRKILTDGIHIAGQHFSFLGFSHSSLRSQSCWFMAPFFYNGSLLFDRELIKGLGNFSHIKIPARCAARIGQAFSNTRDAITLPPGVVKEMKDVTKDKRVFSEGVGTISMKALERIWGGLLAGRKERPTVLQIRYQGAKGMLGLDSRLQGESIFLRESMIKFRESDSNDLEICAAGYKPILLYLNEQMIKILEDMGVDDKFFLDLQAEEVERLRMVTANNKNASRFLKSRSIGGEIDLPWFIERLSHLKLSFQDDSFLADTVETAVLIALRTLKYKARIPVKDGLTLLGIMDETGILEEGEIFCIVDVDGKAKVITGKDGRKVIIGRSPSLHPGDIQLANAVTVPADSPLMQLRNCVCFSQKGRRDLPSKLSGGDLDGDTYHIIFDLNALPKMERGFDPADYDRPVPLDPGRPVGREDMTDFFVTFMETDQLGRICNAHKILADQSLEGVLDERCVRLAEMASTAVDFSKTGIPVQTRNMPNSPHRPHFMAPGPHIEILDEKPTSFEDPQPVNQSDPDDDEYSTTYRYYRSKKVLGRLFDAIDEREVFHRVQQTRSEHSIHGKAAPSGASILQDIWDHIQSQSPGTPWSHHLERARGIRDEYEELLLNTMLEYGPRPQVPLSEVEVFVGNILGKNGTLSTRQREMSTSMKERFGDDLGVIVRCITGRRDASCDGEVGEGEADEGVSRSERFLALSMACLWVGLKESAPTWVVGKTRKVEPRSFGYVAAALCLGKLRRL